MKCSESMPLPPEAPEQNQTATPCKNSMFAPSSRVKPIYIFCFVLRVHLYKLLKAELGAVPSTCWYQSTHLWYALPGLCCKNISMNRVFGQLPGKTWASPCFATSDLDLSCCILTTVRRQVIFPYRKVSPCQVGLWNKEVGFGCWSLSKPWRTTFGTWFCLGTICLSLKALFTFIILQEVAPLPWLADSIESSHFYTSISSTNLQ